MDWVTTSTILENLRDFQNRSAWDRFVSRFHKPIVSFVREMGFTETDAEDVAQEALLAFATAYREGRYDRSKGRLSKWLFGIVYHRVLQAGRRLGRRKAEVPVYNDSFSWSGVPDKKTAQLSWNNTWNRSVLRHCLDQVRQDVEPGTFRAFELTVLCKRSPADVAEELGITQNAVYIAKHRVVHRLRELQQEYEHPD